MKILKAALYVRYLTVLALVYYFPAILQVRQALIPSEGRGSVLIILLSRLYYSGNFP